MARPKIKYWVGYWTKPYGKKSGMIKMEYEPATSLADAKSWVRALKKDEFKHRVWNIRIEKVV